MLIDGAHSAARSARGNIDVELRLLRLAGLNPGAFGNIKERIQAGQIHRAEGPGIVEGEVRWGDRDRHLHLRASCSVKDFDSRTALSALSTLRPRLDATDRIRAAASFSIFRFISSSGLTWTGPMSVTGWAAPAAVPGAMAAMSADSRMNIPAEPA